MTFRSTNYNPKPYVPKSLSEVEDQLASMMLTAPTFIDKSGWFDDDIHSEFKSLTAGLDFVKAKLGEELHARLADLAERAKALFAEDPEDANGKADQGRQLLFEMDNLIHELRSRRVKARLKDEEGEVTGD